MQEMRRQVDLQLFSSTTNSKFNLKNIMTLVWSMHNIRNDILEEKAVCTTSEGH